MPTSSASVTDTQPRRTRPRLMVVAFALVLGILGLGAAPPAWGQQEWLITPAGLGPIELGQSFESVRDNLAEHYNMGDEVWIAPDMQGYAVSVDGEVHVLLPGSEGGRVTSIIVLGDMYRTDADIGPGSLVGAGEDVYGDAAFIWSDADQGRERVVFANGPAGLSFRTSESARPVAGVYPDGASQTVLYHPDAVLTSVWITAAVEDPELEAPPEESESEARAEQAPAEVAEPDAEPEELADEPQAADDPLDSLAQTGNESALLGASGLSLVFLGLGVARFGRRLNRVGRTRRTS